MNLGRQREVAIASWVGNPELVLCYSSRSADTSTTAHLM